MRELFRKFAHKTSEIVGSPWTFCVAVALVVVWAISGPVFAFSEVWQLVINTGTTIITFLTVFLIQNTQNRDSKALHLKLDELIRAKNSASNTFINLENLPDEEIARLQKEFERITETRQTTRQQKA